MANGKTSSGGSGMGSVHKENIKMKEFMSSLGDAAGKGPMKTLSRISPPRLLTTQRFEPPKMSGEQVVNMLLRSMPRETLKMDFKPPKMPKAPPFLGIAKKKEKVYDLGMLPEVTIKSKK